MNNLTKMKILKPAHEVFEAFVDPTKIGNFWFSSSSERWEEGKTITLKYEEYNAILEIKIAKIEQDKRIVFLWGPNDAENKVTISLKEVDPSTTIIEVNEDGFKENDPELVFKLIDNKEGWVFMLTCLKGYLEFGVNQLRGGLVKG
ncbi:SRPBCC family protein [Bacillus sp. FJAT-49736]|uniref:SRPBCC family protein n=1 Tax=Bacillus sp. FJAT-49736 TaxID=2833582 RepID=UPI001BC91226|nr:SRPBCC family protein [Bacillus sp. FJAT-49736]MBS4174397.1 SRPBCC family protein [Bacillus sp. FJAT-49736]